MATTTETSQRRAATTSPGPIRNPFAAERTAQYSQKTVSETSTAVKPTGRSTAFWIFVVIAVIVVIIIIIVIIWFFFFRTPVVPPTTPGTIGTGFTYSVKALSATNQTVSPVNSTLYLVPTAAGTTTTITLNVAPVIGTVVEFKNTGTGTLSISGAQGGSFTVPAGATTVLVLTTTGGYTRLFTAS